MVFRRVASGEQCEIVVRPEDIDVVASWRSRDKSWLHRDSLASGASEAPDADCVISNVCGLIADI